MDKDDGGARREKWARLRFAVTLTGARLSEILNLKWDEIGELTDDGGNARIADTKTGPRTVWLGPEAARLIAALPRSECAARVFPDDLTSARLYAFWCGVREQAGLPGLRIHDCRHTWASLGVMNGVGLTTVGRLLGHRQRETTAIYAHLDDGSLRDAAAQATAVIARARRAPSSPAPWGTGPSRLRCGTRWTVAIYWPSCLSSQALGGRPCRRKSELPSGACPESPIGLMTRRRKTARANLARDRPSTGCDRIPQGLTEICELRREWQYTFLVVIGFS